MKRIVSIVLAAVLLCTTALALASCGDSGKKITKVDDLKGAVIGVQTGTTGDIYASDYEEEGSTIERYSKGADAVVALTQGKVDCVIIDNEPAKAFVEENKGLKILEEPFETEDYAICVSKKNTDLTKNINKALKALKEDGTVDKIIGNYIGTNATKEHYKADAKADTSKGELHMATNASFPPYEYTEKDAVVGIDADIAQAICENLGYKLVIDDMEFDSIITAVQSGKADFGMAGMTVTEERLKSIDFTDSYTTATQVIIVKE